MKSYRNALCVLLLSVSTLAGTANAASAEQADRWKPPVNSRWQYQLAGDLEHRKTGGVDVEICGQLPSGGECLRPQVFDIDLYADLNVVDNNTTLNTAAVAQIHQNGGKAICYVDAGGIENFRPDYKQFTDWHTAHGNSLIGNPYPDFPDERFANINGAEQRAFLLEMTEARVQKCVQAGFDGVEFDVVNTHEADQELDDATGKPKNVSGWLITPENQLIFNRALADLGHRYNLAVGLKNDLSQIDELQPAFDFAINESCSQYEECDALKPFVANNKPVYQVEYDSSPGNDPWRFCAEAAANNFNAIKKNEDQQLLAPFTPCR
ncbi:hypothetical protein GCM10022254_60200 [Actinomadura meridiana]|uniref:Glycoside-hydrolase family GH114 TIM-barrel domain-containing protein n=1 Tax=Actinomadura meridiana TaxID=559626 RepID=A0ABP8CIL0_9ACTN